jgi:hypothetical protein
MQGSRGRPREGLRDRGKGSREGVKSLRIDKEVVVHSPEDCDDTSEDLRYEIE